MYKYHALKYSCYLVEEKGLATQKGIHLSNMEFERLKTSSLRATEAGIFFDRV
jgi:hypothetical protein